MSKDRTAIPIENYIFYVTPHRKSVIVEYKDGSEEELKLILRLYEENIAHTSLKGEFRRCKRSECRFAFYARPDKIRAGEAKYHSFECSYLDRYRLQEWEKEFLNRFCNLLDNKNTRYRAAELLVDTADSPHPDSGKYLDLLARKKPERALEVLNLIFHPGYIIASKKVYNCLRTEKGQKLRELLTTRNVDNFYWLKNISEELKSEKVRV